MLAISPNTKAYLCLVDRTKIIQELAKILEIDLKRKNVDNQEKDSSQDEQQNSAGIDSKGKQSPENAKGNTDGDSSETSEKENTSEKKAP